jgi:head-tail adaptor
MIPAGRRDKRVLVEDPVIVPDSEGGFTQTWVPLTPAWLYVHIQPISGQALQHLVPDATLLSTVTHTITGPYHPGLTTESRLTYGTRHFRVTGVVTPDEDQIESTLLCVETTP